jgi:hypothetical protein
VAHKQLFDGHLIFGERAGLVSTYDTGGTQAFDRRKLFYQCADSRQLPGGPGQGSVDLCRQTLWNN